MLAPSILARGGFTPFFLHRLFTSCGQLGSLSAYIAIIALTGAPPSGVVSQQLRSTSMCDTGLPGLQRGFVVGQVYGTAAGGKVGFAIVGDDYVVNCVRIEKSSAIITKLVVHYCFDPSLRVSERSDMMRDKD